MVKIRLKRMGAKKKPFYRIVVADSRFPRDGRFIEEIGYYDPLKQPAVISINKERALDWLQKGVQLSSTAKALFNKAGVVKGMTLEEVTAAAPAPAPATVAPEVPAEPTEPTEPTGNDQPADATESVESAEN